jgi:Uma2 family endonuclease
MASTTQPSPELQGFDGRLLLRDVGWNDYEAMLEIVGERHVRVTYDRGTMEVAMPPQLHERAAQLFGLFVSRFADELQILYEPLGMTTWRKPDAERGLESDQCYYIKNQAIVRQRDVLDLDIDPPPDLAVEIDITSSCLNRMGIYAEISIPEVWRYDGKTVTFFVLRPDCHNEPSDESASFAALRPAEVEHLIGLGLSMDTLNWARELRKWVQNELIPRRASRANDEQRSRPLHE